MEAVPPSAYNTNYGGRRERVAQASSAHSFRGGRMGARRFEDSALPGKDMGRS
jgi:hypothetical protein